MIETTVFVILILAHVANKNLRSEFINKNIHEWMMDLPNLAIQGLLIPLLQTSLLFYGFQWMMPRWENSLEFPAIMSFLLNFIFIDYLYYWNHRFFHLHHFWPLHKVHHSAKQMDIFNSARNTLWTNFFFIYLWFNAFFIFILKDNEPFILSMAITAALDLWRHSKIFPSNPKWQNFFSHYLFIITPIDHAWHHSNQPQVNFGANLNLFDKLHGTFQPSLQFPKHIGINVPMPLWKKLLYPIL
jgi:sterol desaturase/sphingolipid hydroxylase (fatty acid hydroxylase superfamily)